MSSRSKKRTKEAAAKLSGPVHTIFQKPTGPTPTATVMARRKGEMVNRDSRGFSFGEVENSGIALGTAKKWGLPLDIRRRSVLEQNVLGLKSWYSKAKQVEKPGELRRIEGKIEKIGKEAEKEVKKEVTKVKKGAKKAEKEIVEKVEEPVKARRTKKAARTKKKQ